MNRLLSLLLLTGLVAIPSPAHSADPPPVSLDELVKLYDQFELPNLSKDTPFCIYEWGFNRDERSNGGPVVINRHFAFLAKPKTIAHPYDEVYRKARLSELPPAFRVRVVKPVPESLSRITYFDEGALITAIQCQKLGHKELAAYLFKKYMRHTQEETANKILFSEAKKSLLNEVESYWTEQIENPKMDRKVIIKQLKALHKLTRKTDDEQESSLIHSLELSIAPRTSKPGSLESLIDDLVDAKFDESPFGIHENITQRKLLERGFEIVPLLIEHLGDQRLTRRSYQNEFSQSHLTISNVCGILLDDLAGVELPRVELTEEEKAVRNNAIPGLMLPVLFSNAEKIRPLRVDAVEAWWKKAKATDERKYLLDHLYRNPLGRVQVEGKTRNANASILTMIAARYPSELKGIYLEALKSNRDTYTRPILDAIVHTTIDKPRFDKQTKREILQHGLNHSSSDKRYEAEATLAHLDPDEYTKRLLKRIERMPLADNDPDKHLEERVSILCNLSNDPKVWLALERALKRSPADTQFEQLNLLSYFNGNADHGLIRQERIRVLAAFLDDKTVRTPEEVKKRRDFGVREVYDELELRNYSVIQLAPYFAKWIDYDEYRSDDEWAYLRKWMKNEVENELKQTVPMKAKP